MGNECLSCIELDNVFCMNCNEKIELPICFICPICDNELDDTYCKYCEFEVNYDRFVCGKCRKKGNKCIACGLGYIKEGDSKCIICTSSVENFKWINNSV